ncbi:hypothetical protein SADUNF_Sadunf10G0044800 [Salix dunnii]|uniref:Pectinesterase inhibitor domain-containing protein n=1 Tax=Salix dunnii TaxID=1413687 RepID=A0A835JLV7_9ROSI|nr:hypothetical protein SADUNF_Sadunf10G0044800 [Salix dunnii]
MKTSLSLSFIFLSRELFAATLLLISHCTIVQSDANDLIAQTCKNTPYYNLCVTSLTSVPESSTADVQGLALIMVDIVRDKASTTLEFINQEIKRSPESGRPLRFCASSYDAILTADIPEAIEALQKGDPKFAENGTNDAAIEATSCEDSFQGKSPLTKLNKVVHDTSVVASAITRLLL